MKKYTYLWLIFLVFTVFLVSCHDRNDNTSQGQEDEAKVEETIAAGYDLEELHAFFGGKNTNMPAKYGGADKSLKFEEVDEHFPVEIIGKGYSRYEVKQGGFYYVFWSKMYRSTEAMRRENRSVLFSAYIASDQEVSKFDSLEGGVSTALDVQAIDPAYQLSAAASHGIHSYSYLNDQYLLEIEYDRLDSKEGLESLVVKEIVVIPRENAPSVYGRIKSKDLPSTKE